MSDYDIPELDDEEEEEDDPEAAYTDWEDMRDTEQRGS